MKENKTDFDGFAKELYLLMEKYQVWIVHEDGKFGLFGEKFMDEKKLKAEDTLAMQNVMHEFNLKL